VCRTYGAFFMLTALQPLLRQRLLEVSRQRLIAKHALRRM
jgi:hypothetical protein